MDRNLPRPLLETLPPIFVLSGEFSDGSSSQSLTGKSPTQIDSSSANNASAEGPAITVSNGRTRPEKVGIALLSDGLSDGLSEQPAIADDGVNGIQGRSTTNLGATLSNPANPIERNNTDEVAADSNDSERPVDRSATPASSSNAGYSAPPQERDTALNINYGEATISTVAPIQVALLQDESGNFLEPVEAAVTVNRAIALPLTSKLPAAEVQTVTAGDSATTNEQQAAIGEPVIDESGDIPEQSTSQPETVNSSISNPLAIANDPVTEQPVEPATDPTTEQPVEPANSPVIEQPVESAPTESGESQSSPVIEPEPAEPAENNSNPAPAEQFTEPAAAPVTEPNPTVETAPTNQPVTATGRFNYGEALQKSFLFYEAQRSGALPDDNRIAWRGHSALDDGSEVGLDLSGGYFDAGDHVKYNFPMAASMTMLSWGVEQYRQGYEQSGQLDEALDAIRWGTDFLLKSHIVENGETKAFWAQVGNPRIDQLVPELPENIQTRRPAYKIDASTPGTELAAEVAAALASASIIFRPTDSAYADELLENAQQLYRFADTYRGSYVAALPRNNRPYRPGDGFRDELAWGAAWLHKAIKAQGHDSQAYLAKAKAAYHHISDQWTQDWDNKSHGAAILLAQETGDDWYKENVSRWLGNWMEDGAAVDYTEGGLAWLHGWGSLRLSANTAFLAGIYADTVEDPNGAYSQFAEQQIDYILGDNPRGASYVVGFGDNAPQRVHHQAAAQYMEEELWTSDLANTNIIYGALVGGPTAPDDFAYQDIRSDFYANEVGLDYNAAYTGAVARLYSQYGGNPLSDRELHDLPGIQIAAIANAQTSQP